MERIVLSGQRGYKGAFIYARDSAKLEVSELTLRNGEVFKEGMIYMERDVELGLVSSLIQNNKAIGRAMISSHMNSKFVINACNFM